MLGLLDKSLKIYVAMFESTSDSKDELLPIGKFAKFCNVPISTIRYYLRIQKLKPRSYTNAGYMPFDKEQTIVVRNLKQSNYRIKYRYCNFRA